MYTYINVFSTDLKIGIHLSTFGGMLIIIKIEKFPMFKTLDKKIEEHITQLLTWMNIRWYRCTILPRKFYSGLSKLEFRKNWEGESSSIFFSKIGHNLLESPDSSFVIGHNQSDSVMPLMHSVIQPQ